jgi:hypothetical protein
LRCKFNKISYSARNFLIIGKYPLTEKGIP